VLFALLLRAHAAVYYEITTTAVRLYLTLLQDSTYAFPPFVLPPFVIPSF
jgi:hypothetical protein